MSADTFKVGDRVVTVPGPDFGYSWEGPRVGTVTGHHASYDLHFVVFDYEDDPAMKEEGWLLRDHEIKHIDSEENTMLNIEDKTPEEIAEMLATASPSDRAEVFIQSLEKDGLVREALKALVLAVDRADASVNDAVERGDLSDTDEWFYSGMQTATDGANDFMQSVLVFGSAPEIDAWT